MRRVGLWAAVGCACVAFPDSLPDYDDPPEAEEWDGEVDPDDYACMGTVRFSDELTGVTRGSALLGFDEQEPTWLLYRYQDRNGNGLPEYVERYERDAEGREIRYERERQQAEIRQTTYNAEGQRVRVDVDIGADGVSDGFVVDTYEDGQLSIREDDIDGDGVIDRSITYVYDALDRPAAILVDLDLDGVVDDRYVYDWGDSELSFGAFTVALDQGDDGVVDQITDVETDIDGNRLSLAEDFDADGVPESEEVATYDASGNLLTRRIEATFSSGASTLQQETYEYDRLGRVVLAIERYDIDGVPFQAFRVVTAYGGTCP